MAISPLGMMDDDIFISICGNNSVNGNSIINSYIAAKIQNSVNQNAIKCTLERLMLTALT